MGLSKQKAVVLDKFLCFGLGISNLISGTKHSTIGKDDLKVCVTFNFPFSNQKHFHCFAKLSHNRREPRSPELLLKSQNTMH